MPIAVDEHRRRERFQVRREAAFPHTFCEVIAHDVASSRVGIGLRYGSAILIRNTTSRVVIAAPGCEIQSRRAFVFLIACLSSAKSSDKQPREIFSELLFVQRLVTEGLHAAFLAARSFTNRSI